MSATTYIMAYNAVAQNELSDSDSDVSRSPSPTHGHAFPSLQEANHLEGNQLETATTNDNPTLVSLGSMIRSMTTASYDVVEDDDYDVDHSPEDLRRIPPLKTTVARHSSPDPEPPLQSASSDLPIPLSHPTPDLQTIQGAYTGNVERLEQSAERLSSSSADIGSEIRKMDLEQKRRSCSSASNSIIMRNGTFSPVATASPHGSTRSTRQRSVSGGSRLAQVAEPDHDEDVHFLDRHPATLPVAHASQIPIDAAFTERFSGQYDGEGGAQEMVRSPSAASNDTYQQARTLFTDFDGVHFASVDPADLGRQVSISQPPLASKPESYKEPQLGKNMVYYPAPVPQMLNLPPKLSRKPVVDREKRRTQLLNHIASEDRKSAPGLPASDQDQPSQERRDKRQSTIPPQLRASVFFDPPSTTLEVEVKQNSAVATLESILDASANAPVSAFTDHPFAGHVGSYVYGNQKRKSMMKHPPGQKGDRQSQYLMSQSPYTDEAGEEGDLAHSVENFVREYDQHRSHDEHNSESSESTETGADGHSPESEEDEEQEEEYVDYVGPPNTLLAELEMRKQELKQRTRPAVPQPGPGMRATLLQMDEMAQKQSEKRRRRPVTLAWDGDNGVDDDDVPLAMLFPDKVNAEEERPLGLLERREQEENEPLSARRARLRGEPIPEKRPVTVYATEATKPSQQQPETESGNELETLAERLRRIKGQNPAESDFTNDLLAEFDSRVGTATKESEGTPDPENETLAQRRSRLQKEHGTQAGNPKNPRVRRSMAALPQVHQNHIVGKSSHDLLQRHSMMPLQGNRMSMQQLPANAGYQAPSRYSMVQPYNYGMAYPPTYPHNNIDTMNLNGGYTMPNGCRPNMTIRQPPDPAQRDLIDRWRQSIR